MPNEEKEWCRAYIEKDIKRLEKDIQEQYLILAKEVMELAADADREVNAMVDTLVYLKKKLERLAEDC